MGMKQTKLAQGKYLSNLKNIPDRRKNQLLVEMHGLI